MLVPPDTVVTGPHSPVPPYNPIVGIESAHSLVLCLPIAVTGPDGTELPVTSINILLPNEDMPISVIVRLSATEPVKVNVQSYGCISWFGSNIENILDPPMHKVSYRFSFDKIHYTVEIATDLPEPTADMALPTDPR